MMHFREHRWVYLVLAALFGVLVVVAPLLYHQQKVTEESQAKATEFVDKLIVADFPIRDRDRAIERAAETFGTDGGELLADPQSAYYHALANFRLGNGGALTRPGILDDDVFVAEWIALQVYRGPEAAAEFSDWYGEMKFDDVSGE